MKKIFILILLCGMAIQASRAQKQKQNWEDRYYERALTRITGNRFIYSNYVIERLEAENFNFEDENIRFNIFFISDMSFWIRIYNKSNNEMICKWTRALIVIDGQTNNFAYFSTNPLGFVSAALAPRYIAPLSFYQYSMSPTGTSYMYKKSRIKKNGPALVRLLIPIEVNGKEEMYDFKYKVSLPEKKKK